MSEALRAIEGEWTLVFAVRDGQPLGADFVATGRRTLRDGVTTVRFRNQVFMQGTTRIDTTCSPHAIDYVLTGPPGRGKRQLGVWELDGEQLRICVAPPGRERPADFTTRLGDDRTLTVWRRAGDAAGDAGTPERA